MAVRLKELERAYFVRKAGGAAPNVPFNQVKRDYIAGFIGGLDRSTKMEEVEILFLRKIADDDGQTPAKYYGDLWKQAVIAAGGTPSDNLNENKIYFYLNAA